VASDDLPGFIDQHGRGPSELGDRRRDLLDLIIGMQAALRALGTSALVGRRSTRSAGPIQLPSKKAVSAR
jgi:hypothetical protein